MRLLVLFARSYPWRSASVVALLLVGTAVTGFGTATMLPTLAALIGQESANAGALAAEPGREGSASRLETGVLETLEAFGLAPTLEVLIGVMVAMALLRAALVIPTNFAVGNAVARVARDLRIRLIRAIVCARWDYLTRQRVGVLAAGFATEADRAAGAYLAAATLCARGLQVLLLVGLAWLVSPQVTLAGLGIGIGIGVVLVSFVGAARRAGNKQTRITREALSRLQSTFVSLKPLKAMAQEEVVRERLDRDSERLFRTLKRLVMTRETLRALQELLIAATVAGLAFVVLRHLEMPFQSLLVLLFLFVRMLTGASKVQRGFQELASLESAYFALIDTAESAEAAAEPLEGREDPPERIRHAVEIDSVSVSYGGAPVLRDFSLRIEAGRITALRGPSGCGKTTVADLVCGLLQPEAGEIRVDGVPLASLDLHRWRASLGYVAQDTLLLGGSVARNVTLSDPRVGEEDLRSALRDAQALEVFEALPEGLETRVGMGGARLSGGQRQRVAIARALAHRPALLILDEATSALDPDTERALYQTLRDREDAMTILAISHQEALLEVADQVYTFPETSAEPEVDAAPHSTLLAHGAPPGASR